MLELIKSGVWDRSVTRDGRRSNKELIKIPRSFINYYFRNYSNFSLIFILDFLRLILILKYITTRVLHNINRHLNTFKHETLVANFVDIFTDPQRQLTWMDRHRQDDRYHFLRQISKAVRLIEYPRRGTREARRDFSPLPPFFLYQSYCPSGHQLLFDSPPVILRSFTRY